MVRKKVLPWTARRTRLVLTDIMRSRFETDSGLQHGAGNRPEKRKRKSDGSSNSDASNGKVDSPPRPNKKKREHGGGRNDNTVRKQVTLTNIQIFMLSSHKRGLLRDVARE